MKDTDYSRRRKRYRELMRREDLGGLYIGHLPDVRYLCGFTGSNGIILLLARSGYFLSDFRYREQSAAEVKGLKVLIYEKSPLESLRRALKGYSGLSLGFDPNTLVYGQVLDLRRELRGKARVLPLKGPLALLRAVKSPWERQVMGKALRLAEEAFRDALKAGNEDNVEASFAAALDCAARKRGAEDRAFETIVAGGTRGAVVHASPSKRKLRGAVVVDWGVRYRGYHTDMTRTLDCGGMSSSLKKAYDVVIEAQERALKSIKPGVKASDVDRAARELIEEEGYGAFFGHALGHGVGLEVHERPYVGKNSRDVIEEGMVFTVEPGIYLPGKGGVRVEDMVLVRSGGAELLSSLPRSLDPSDYR
jgi:Xaa-Pro aminopeptidase